MKRKIQVYDIKWFFGLHHIGKYTTAVCRKKKSQQQCRNVKKKKIIMKYSIIMEFTMKCKYTKYTDS